MQPVKILTNQQKDKQKYFRGLLTSRNLSVKLVDILILSQESNYLPGGYLTHFIGQLPEPEKDRYQDIMNDILKAREQLRIKQQLEKFGLINQ